MMQLHIKRNGLWNLLAALTASACLTTIANAQVPEDIMSASGQLTATQTKTLHDFVTKAVGDLSGTDPKVAKTAGRQLLAPFSRTRITNSFKMAYSAELVPLLGNLVSNRTKPMHSRLEALNILGSIASDGIIPILEGALQSDQDAIRYNAALAFERAMQSTANQKDIFKDRGQTTRDMIRALHQSMSSEKSPFVLSAILTACAADPNSAYSLLNLCDGLQSQMHSLYKKEVPQTMVSVYQKGVGLALKRYIGLLGNGSDLREQEKSLAQLGFTAMQLGVAEGLRGRVVDTNKSNYAKLVQDGENLLDVVCRLDSDNKVTDQQRKGVSKAFTDGNYTQANNIIKSFWLQPTGPIYGSPHFSIAAGSLDHLFGP